MGLILLSPIFLLIAFGIKLGSKGPILFNQKRVGLNGQLFGLVKFRTMKPDSEKGGQLTVGKDKRITSIGRFLRKYKLDELPQLWNVLVGDMNLVGPRPEVPRYVELYSPGQRRVLLVKPGITDPASIQYRDENELLANSDNPEKTYIEQIMPVKLSLNLEYIRTRDFWTDFSIILKTIKAIIV